MKNLPRNNLRRKRRGSAMVELMICLLPYSLMVLGISLLSDLTVSRQELLKAMAWSSPKPNDQSGEVDDTSNKRKFFANSQGKAAFWEQSINPAAGRLEPVLPYDSSGLDMAAARVRLSTRVKRSYDRQSDGTIKSVVSEEQTGLGKYLESRGIDLLDGEISLALGEFVSYRQSGGTYTNQEMMSLSPEILDEGKYELSNAPSGSPTGYSMRKAYVLGKTAAEATADEVPEPPAGQGPPDEAKETDSLATFYSAAPDPAGYRGDHSGGGGTGWQSVKLNELTPLASGSLKSGTDDLNTVISTYDSAPKIVTSPSSTVDFWNKNRPLALPTK